MNPTTFFMPEPWCALLLADDDDYDRGFALGAGVYVPDEDAPDVVGASGEFNDGFHAGFMFAIARERGQEAALAGLRMCPEEHDDYFREVWLDAFFDSSEVGGHA